MIFIVLVQCELSEAKGYARQCINSVCQKKLSSTSKQTNVPVHVMYTIPMWLLWMYKTLENKGKLNMDVSQLQGVQLWHL